MEDGILERDPSKVYSRAQVQLVRLNGEEMWRP
jgi:hypothetical protein